MNRAPVRGGAAESPIPARVGHFRIENRLGRGGMGEVYRAFDEALERPVAVKRIRPDATSAQALERLRREARIAARLRHPNIVAIYHLEQAQGGDWIVMELVEGRTLAEALADEGPPSIPRTLAIALGVTRGLAAAHAAGILHRDLKAANIMLTPSGEARILDLGLAKPWQGGGSADEISSPGLLVGTPHAMAPEQIVRGRLGPFTDLFALGSLLYETVTGQRPFRGSNPRAEMSQVCVFEPIPAVQHRPEVPAAFSRLLEALMAKDPRDRPASASEVMCRLEAIAGDARPAAAGPGDPGSPPPAAPADPPSTLGEPTREVTPADVTPGERRPVTFLRCIVRWAGDRPPADPGAVVGEAVGWIHHRAAAIVAELLGHTQNVSSDGLMAYFGYPHAHGQDVRRAVRAGLRLLGALGDPVAEVDTRLGLGVVVHTGEVVVIGPVPAKTGDGPSLPFYPDAVGEAARMTARLARRIPPGGVFVTSAVHRQLLGAFECAPPERLPGLELEVRRVIRGKDVETGWAEPSVKRALVGRDAEAELLERRWRDASIREGQAVLVCGESGLGKTCLVEALHARLRLAPSESWICRCLPEHQKESFRPMVAALWQLLALPRDAPGRWIAVRLKDVLRDSGLPTAEVAALLAPLLRLGRGELAELGADLSPQPPRQDLRRLQAEALVELWVRWTERRPVFWLVEDLHWADRGTLDLLEILVGQLPATRLLLVATFEPRLEIPWRPTENLTRVILHPLDREQIDRLIDQSLTGGQLAPAVREEIHRQAGGVPFVAEELTRMVLDQTSPEPHEASSSEIPLGIPARIREALTARLDLLDPGPRKVAQLGSVLGSSFLYDELLAISPFDEGTLLRFLNDLVVAGLLVRRGLRFGVRYFFKHLLIRRVARRSLLLPELRRCHGQLAEALASRFPETVATQPERLAYHYARAGRLDEAWPCYLRAGRLASERGDLDTARRYLQTGLRLLSKLPESATRRDAQRELHAALHPDAA